MLQGDSDTLNVSAFKLTQLQMQWGYNIKKQWINAEQTPKLDTEQWVNGEQADETLLKHSVVLWHTFASTKRKIMLTNVWLSRKIWQNKKKEQERPRPSVCPTELLYSNTKPFVHTCKICQFVVPHYAVCLCVMQASVLYLYTSILAWE